MISHLPRSALFPYTTLFRSERRTHVSGRGGHRGREPPRDVPGGGGNRRGPGAARPDRGDSLHRLEHLERSEEHTSELQSHSDLVCRLLLEKKKKTQIETK